VTAEEARAMADKMKKMLKGEKKDPQAPCV